MEDNNYYGELIDDGMTIQELLRSNAGHVGSIGELLELAAEKLDEQEKRINLLEQWVVVYR